MTGPVAVPARRRRRSWQPSPRQVNLALEGLLVISILSGIGSWMVTLEWARPLTFIHAVSGFSMILLTPLKLRGSVAAGFRRNRSTRGISALFGILTLATIALGAAHSTGVWYGIGLWSAQWTHLLFGFSLIPLAIWHVRSRPVHAGRVDLNRRALLSAGGLTVAATAAVGAQEGLIRLAGLDGARRAGTGSHEVASFDPAGMPVVSWLDDRTPQDDLETWTVELDGRPLSVAELVGVTTALETPLDCTGGWRSTQRWDTIPLSAVLPDRDSRSVRVVSATGYSRIFARADCDRVHLCTGYDGQPLRRGHGAPVRLVVPGRRGPWWVKWVTAIELSDRPAWLQLPFSPT